MASSQPPPKANPFTAANARLAQIFQQVEDGLAPPCKGGCLHCRDRGDLGNIRARHKSLAAGASHNEAGNSGVVADILQRRTDFRHSCFVQSVERLGPVDGQVSHSSIFLDGNIVESRHLQTSYHYRGSGISRELRCPVT
jgi:hypothetical protein